ncbi:XrtA system polysaccharide chain length determinant [Marinobacter sp. 1Y8]
MALPLSHLPGEIFREVRVRKWHAVLVFAIVSFGVLALGFLWPYKYDSEVVIFVDDQNIIGPLMEGSAVTTEINDRASAAKELLWSRNVMQKVATDTNIYGAGASSLEPDKLEARIVGLRKNLNVRTRGESFFSIGYSAESPMQAFRIAQRLGQAFIEASTSRKKAESRSAYEFIDKQVRSYERQLSDVEGRLKVFLSENVDGTEQEANQKMAGLRGKLELAKLEKRELGTRVGSLERQLGNVSSTFRQERTQDAYQARIRAMQEQLDALRLKYHDTYPDIVILQEQLSELKKQRAAAIAGGGSTQSIQGEQIVNPLYQELSADLAKARTDIETVNTRIQSLEDLIGEQVERMQRIQSNKAEYSELTRDMEVNKQIYDDLLKRRERARVSMHLDIEGQGLNYRINETAQFPLAPSGPQFFQFAAVGLLLGLIAPFGAIAGLLQVDPRVRAKAQLEGESGIPVLIEIPNIRTPFEKRRDRRVTMSVIICAAIVAVVYIAVAVSSVMGVF